VAWRDQAGNHLQRHHVARRLDADPGRRNSNLNALRYEQWKIHFAWIEGHLFSGKRTSANVPLVINLRQDPFERTPFESDFYRRFQADKLWTLVPAQAIAGQLFRHSRSTRRVNEAAA
jgi:hypothetical protein